ncbi:MAG: RNA 2',3'-cyclic phosphodiesterase [Desulfobacterales bacterium]|nr:RNA 2',3'-cyclic phosphodiesterase [Desulfobacterales bacterium]
MPRLFTAIDLPARIKMQLVDLGFGIPGARWLAADQVHLTLCFIGEVDGAVFKDIREALTEVRSPGFSLRLKGVGHFPPRKAPRVLWAGVEANEALVRLRNQVQATLVRQGLKPEGRKYSPHITLARLNNAPANKIGQFLAGNNLFTSKPFAVAEFHLFCSRLTPKGAIHSIEATYPLSPGNDPNRQE